MTRRIGLALVLLATVSAAAHAQSASSARLTGIGIDERLDAEPALATALAQSRLAPSGLALFVRLLADWDVLRSAAASGRWEPLDARVDLYRRLSIPVLLSIQNTPTDAEQSESWRQFVQALAEHNRDRIAGYQIETSRSGPPPDVKTYAFLLRLAAAQIRAADPHALIAQTTVGPSQVAWQSALFAEDSSVFVDIVAVENADAAGPGAAGAAAPLLALIHKSAPACTVLFGGVAVNHDGSVQVDGAGVASAEPWLAYMFGRMGQDATLYSFTGSAEALSAALATVAPVRDLFSGDLVTVDDRTASVTIELNGMSVIGRVPHRLFYGPGTSTHLVYWGLAPDAAPLTVTLIDQAGRTPTLRNAPGQDPVPGLRFSWDASSKISTLTVPSSRSPIVIDFNYDAGHALASSVNVTAAASLSVAEIVFRHQQAQAAQDALYRNYDAAARMEQHFRASPTQAFDLVSENHFYVSRTFVEWEQLSFTVNGAHLDPTDREFPLLQAEKVLSLPLDLRLTTDYRYQLEGTDDTGGHLCYVVRFDPVDETRVLYRGRVWIDVESFNRIKVNAIEGHMSAPIVSNEETQFYQPVATVSGQPLYLSTRLSQKQIFLIAGRNVLLEKESTFSNFQIDAPDFDARLQAAHASDRIMFRDTDQGLRYLIKRDGQRVVSDRITTTSKALAMGTTIDPTFAFPLPIFGINYLNFDFPGHSQLALLFGGVLALGNVQKPKLGRTPFDASVDFFGMAVPSSDLVFDASGERRDERLLTFPVSTGANIGYQFSAFQKITLNYTFRYDWYLRDSQTAADFVAPTSTATNGLGAAYEFKRQGYLLGATMGGYRRMSWAAWGRPGDFNPATQTYRRYSATASKDFFLTSFQTVHVGVGWYGGRNLDRFSMYQFGLFDEVRMHGVPAAGVRFPELGLARASYSFNVFNQYRLDLFFDQALGRDPVQTTVWRPVTGTGIAASFRGPWNMLVNADIGKGFLPQIYARTGSWVFQILLLKPL